MTYTEKEENIRMFANEIMMKIWNEDKSGRLLYLFIAKLCGLTSLKAFGIKDKYKPYIVTKDKYDKFRDLISEKMEKDIYYIVYLKDGYKDKLELTTINKRFCGKFNHNAHGVTWFELNGSGAYVAVPDEWIECIAPSKELWSE